MKHPQVCNIMNSYSHCSQFSFSDCVSYEFDSWTKFMKLDETRINSRIEQSILYKNICDDEMNEIFRLIARSKLIICSIKRQNAKIKQLIVTDYKATALFEKVKIIDLIKLLICTRKELNVVLTKLEQTDCYFLNEIQIQISSLEESCKCCAEFQINENEVTNEFGLSGDVIDCILNDCGLDLAELDRLVSNEIEDFENKLNSMKISNLSTIQKSRMERRFNKVLSVFENIVCSNLTCINKILTRLFSGYSNSIIDSHFFNLTPDELAKYYCELNQFQISKIINLKKFLLDLEKKVTEFMLVMKEFQMILSSENIVHKGKNSLIFLENILSPISKSSTNRNSSYELTTSFLSSTPGSNGLTKNMKSYSVLSESNEILNEESISSFDSGYLLTSGNEHSFRDSCDNFDVIPFSDDEYEKILDEDFKIPETEQDLDFCDSLCTASEIEIPYSEIISDFPEINFSNTSLEFDLDFDSKEFCRKNNFCKINSADKFLFSSNGNSKLSEKKIIDNSIISFKRMNIMNSLVFDIEVVMNLEKIDMDIRQKIALIINIEEWESKFNNVLHITIQRIRQFPSINLNDHFEYLIAIIKSCNSSKINNLNYFETTTNAGTQLNNSAHTTYGFSENNVVSCEKNTNNNADSKDDDSSDLSMTHNCSINNDEGDSLCLDAELQVAFKTILSDSISTDHIVNPSELSSVNQLNEAVKFNNYRDVTVNIYNTSFSDESTTDFWPGHISSDLDEASHNETNNKLTSEFIEDVNLVVKLSELHLRSEYQSELHNKSALIYDKNRIVDNYKSLKSQLIKSCDDDGNKTDIIKTCDWNENCSKSPVVNRNKTNVSIQIKNSVFEKKQIETNESTKGCDTGNESREEVETEFYNNINTKFSSDLSQNQEDSLESDQQILRELEAINDDELMSYTDRISLTINLTEKLLDFTNYQLKLISSLFNKNISSAKSTIARNKSLSICSLKQRLLIVVKILSNLRFAIQNTYDLEIQNSLCREIEALICKSESLTKFAVDIENRMKANGCDMVKNDCYNFEHELPDDLLIKIEPNDLDAIVSISTCRLQITIAALSQYPCHDYFQKSQLPKINKLLNISLAVNFNLENNLNPSDLLQKLFKLRRITAICALNIVDLHVILTKLEHEGSTAHNTIEDKIKNLLIVWHALDGECHRLLRCTNLVYDIMTDTRKVYVDLVSLLAVIQSIMTTVELSNTEMDTMRAHFESLMNYKQRILEWLDEIHFCVSIIYKKRMTSKRFKYYDEIHHFLEENLNTISELSDRIKKECNRAVNFVNDVITYCSNLPNCSITDIGKLMITDSWISNKHLYYSECKNEEINENIFHAIIDLEELTMRINNSIITNENLKSFSDHFHEFLDQGKDIFQVINMENTEVIISEKNNSSMITGILLQNSKAHSQKIFSDETVTDNAAEKIIDKISKIAACAASNALILFIDKYELEFSDNNDTDHQISLLTSFSDNSDIMKELYAGIIDSVSASLTLAIIDNILSNTWKDLSPESDIVLRGICQDLSHRAVSTIVQQVVSNQEVINEVLLSETSKDIANYLCEELGCLMVNSSLQEIQIVDVPTNRNIIFISTCVSKLENQLFGNLVENSKFITSDLIDFQFEQANSMRLSSSDACDSNDCKENYIKEFSILPENCFNPVPISFLKRKYDTQEVCKGFNELHDRKLAAVDARVHRKTRQTDYYKCISSHCEINKPVTEINLPKQKFNRITKLVAKFNQNTIGNSQLKNAPFITQPSIERFCLNLINLKSIQLVEEISRDVIKEFQVHNVFPMVIENCENESRIHGLSNHQKSVVKRLEYNGSPGEVKNQVDRSEIVLHRDCGTIRSVKHSKVFSNAFDNRNLQANYKSQCLPVICKTQLEETESEIKSPEFAFSTDELLSSNTGDRNKHVAVSGKVFSGNSETIIKDPKPNYRENSHKNQTLKEMDSPDEESGLEITTNLETINTNRNRLDIHRKNMKFNVSEIENLSNQFMTPLESFSKKNFPRNCRQLTEKESLCKIDTIRKFNKSANVSLRNNSTKNKIDFHQNHNFTELLSKPANSSDFIADSSRVQLPKKENHFSKFWLLIIALILILVLVLYQDNVSEIRNYLAFDQLIFPKISSTSAPPF